MMVSTDRRYVSCPVCGRILMKCQGNCSIEITCSKCSSDIIAIIDEEKVSVLENLRKNERNGQVKVSLSKNQDNKQRQPLKKAVNF